MMDRFRLLAFLPLVLLSGCSDDPTEPNAFAVAVTVVDTHGAPVPGLALNVTSDNDYLQDAFAKALIRIPFEMAVHAQARITIEDIEGVPIRTLADGEVPAGPHQVEWNGKNDAGTHQPSGYYTARLRVREIGTNRLVFEDTSPMLMCLLGPRVYPVGVTDADGRVVLRDKRLFPHLYDPPPLDAADENGEIRGTLELTAAIIFALGDTASATSMYVVREVSGPEALEFVWDPSGLPSPRLTPSPAPGAAGEPQAGGFSLGPVYPNPFN